METTQLIKAKILGHKAFKAGKLRVPAHDPELMAMLKDGIVGDIHNLRIMKKWIIGWENANEESEQDTL